MTRSMTRSMTCMLQRLVLPMAATVALMLTMVGCGTNTDVGGGAPVSTQSATGSPPTQQPGKQHSSRPGRPVSIPADDPYVHLAKALHSRGVAVWFETDLVASWLAGPSAFHATVARLGGLARVPGVVGFKVADELGYHDGLSSPQQALAFLRAAHQALARVAPHTQLLVDMVVPELGCLSSEGPHGACAVQARASSPAATVAAVTSYLRTGWIDRLDLSTGLLDPSTYAAQGLTLAQAQEQAWQQVQALGWGRMTHLQARKALAAAGGWHGSEQDARQDVDVYVSIPHQYGADAVDIWTWRQPYDGATVSLLSDDLRPNALWQSLARIRGPHLDLITHMTPSAMPTAPRAFAHECDVAARLFGAVFVAAGTG